MNARGWRARSALECSGWPPLSLRAAPSVAGAAHSRRSALAFALAQPFSIPWHTIDGSGDTSTGGVYTVSDTIGQPDAGGPMTNGQYSVTGGFWALPQAVQTPGAPTPTIAPANPGFATISWTPATGANWILQERPSLSAGSWTNAPSGWTNPVVVPAALSTKFFRLFKP